MSQEDRKCLKRKNNEKLEMDQGSRKRMRSEDCPYSVQTKCYVSQQLVDSNNAEKMRKIHDKTLGLLFKGARHYKNYNTNLGSYRNQSLFNNLRLCGNGIIQFEGGKKPLGFPEVPIQSKCCKKLALVNAECRNCNLVVCEFCAYSCTCCFELLCGACVSLFGCGTVDSPCCDQCKMFY